MGCKASWRVRRPPADHGVLAQLGRASEWHSEGQGCKSLRFHFDRYFVGLSPTRVIRKKVMRKAGWIGLVAKVTSAPIEKHAHAYGVSSYML